MIEKLHERRHKCLFETGQEPLSFVVTPSEYIELLKDMSEASGQTAPVTITDLKVMGVPVRVVVEGIEIPKRLAYFFEK